MDKTADMLKTIFEMQKSLDTDIVEKRHLKEITPEEWVQKEILAMVSELAELLAEVNFKWWKNPKEVDYDKVKDELIDVLHFFSSTCLKVGMDADELFDRYLKKNKENFDRQYGRSTKEGYDFSKLKDGKK